MSGFCKEENKTHCLDYSKLEVTNPLGSAADERCVAVLLPGGAACATISTLSSADEPAPTPRSDSSSSGFALRPRCDAPRPRLPIGGGDDDAAGAAPPRFGDWLPLLDGDAATAAAGELLLLLLLLLSSLTVASTMTTLHIGHVTCRTRSLSLCAM